VFLLEIHYLNKMSINKKINLSLLLLLFFSFLTAQIGPQEYHLPFDNYLYQEVSENVDPGLQLSLERIIAQNPTYARLAVKKKLAVGLVDLRDPAHLKYAAINSKHMMYAASLPKIAVLLSAMEAVNEGCLRYDEDLKSDLRLMIAKSNNAATTRVIERLGFDQIASVMRDDKYDFYDKYDGGGLWVGKKYAKSGRKKPDPLKGISHAATVEQVCRYYTMLAYGKLVNEEFNLEMMRYLKDPEINHKFVKTLNKLAPNADVYRKSGSWRNFHADSALVFGDQGRQYILVVLAESPSGSRICSQMVRHAEKILGINKTPLLASKRNQDKPTVKKMD